MERCDLRLHLGERVRLTEAVDNYPDVFVPEGNEGVLSRVENDSVWIKLDKHFPELSEWNNEVQIWDWSDQKLDGDISCHPCDYIEVL